MDVLSTHSEPNPDTTVAGPDPTVIGVAVARSVVGLTEMMSPRGRARVDAVGGDRNSCERRAVVQVQSDDAARGRNPEGVAVGEQRLRAVTDIDHTRGVEPNRFGQLDRGRLTFARRWSRPRRVCVLSERDERDHDRDNDHRDGHVPRAQDATTTTNRPRDESLVAVDHSQHSSTRHLGLLALPRPAGRLASHRILVRDPLDHRIVHASLSVIFEVSCSMPSCAATRPRARCSLTRNAELEHPATTAASRGDSPSQATSKSASRSRSVSTPRASVSSTLNPAGGDHGPDAGDSRRSRSVNDRRRRAPRRWSASTRRATPKSQGSAKSGTSSSRRQATKNVSATTSSTTIPADRRTHTLTSAHITHPTFTNGQPPRGPGEREFHCCCDS